MLGRFGNAASALTLVVLASAILLAPVRAQEAGKPSGLSPLDYPLPPTASSEIGRAHV